MTIKITPTAFIRLYTTMEGSQYDMQKIILTIIGLSFSLTFTNDSEDYKYRRKLLKHTANSMASLKPENINPLVGMDIRLIYTGAGQLKDTEALALRVRLK